MKILIGSNGPLDPTEGLTLTASDKEYLQSLQAHDWLYSLQEKRSVSRKGDEKEAFLKMYAVSRGGNCLQMYNRFCYLRRKHLKVVLGKVHAH